MKAISRIMNLKVMIIFIVMFSMVGLSGCAFKNYTSKQKYLAALDFFNNRVEQYAVAYDEASPETKAKWKKNVDPIIKKASTALVIWKMSIGTSEESSKEKVWNTIKNELINVLFESDIIKLE